MQGSKRFITESDERHWLEVTPRAAAAGGLVVVLLLGAIMLLHPGERGAAGRAALATRPESPAVSKVPADTAQVSMPNASDPTPAGPAAIVEDADGPAAPDNHPPTF
jgi:hypothetical protein